MLARENVYLWQERALARILHEGFGFHGQTVTGIYAADICLTVWNDDKYSS